MAINPLGGAGPGSIIGAGSTPGVGKGKETFGEALKAQHDSLKPKGAEGPQVLRPQPPVTEAKGTTKAAAGPTRVEGASKVEASAAPMTSRVLDHVSAAQARMDQILKLAESGRDFSPAELLSLQTHVYRASQELDLAGKVVEKATNGIKQVLQTQV
jgi:hypothetical protein